MGAHSDFISEQFAPSERHKAQQQAMAETLSAAGLNPCGFDSLSTAEETVSIAKRKLRIVGENPLLGICEYCNMQFSSLAAPGVATDGIEQQFDAHKCKRQDFAQNAARIVRDAAESQT